MVKGATISSGGGTGVRAGGPSLVSLRSGFSSVKSFGPVRNSLKPAQGFGRGPEARNSTPIRAESRWAKPSPQWSFLKDAKPLRIGMPASTSEASFRSVRPVSEAKVSKPVEKGNRFNPLTEKGRKRFAYRQAARIPIESSLNPNIRGQINDILTQSARRPKESERAFGRINTLRARYGKREAIEVTQVDPKVGQNRLLAEKRAKSMQRLQPLIDAGVLTQSQAQQAVETAAAPKTRTSNKTETRLKTELQTLIKEDTEVATKKKVKRAVRPPQKRNSLNKREIVYQQDQAAQNATNAEAKRVFDEISLENNRVSGREFAEKFRFSRRMRSRLLDQLGKREKEDGRWDNLDEAVKAETEITLEKFTALNEAHSAVELRERDTAPQVGERAVIEVLDQDSEEVTQISEGNSTEITKRSALRVLIEKTLVEEYQSGQEVKGLEEISSEPDPQQADQRKVVLFALDQAPVEIFAKKDIFNQNNLNLLKTA